VARLREIGLFGAERVIVLPIMPRSTAGRPHRNSPGSSGRKTSIHDKIDRASPHRLCLQPERPMTYAFPDRLLQRRHGHTPPVGRGMSPCRKASGHPRLSIAFPLSAISRARAQAMASAETTGMARSAKTRRAAPTEPLRSMPRVASSITTTAKPQRCPSSAE
jgi:hypothetical protein